MEKARKRIKFCMVFVVLTAVVIGIFYYYGQMLDKPSNNEGTLISNVQMGMRRLCR